MESIIKKSYKKQDGNETELTVAEGKLLRYIKYRIKSGGTEVEDGEWVMLSCETMARGTKFCRTYVIQLVRRLEAKGRIGKEKRRVLVDNRVHTLSYCVYEIQPKQPILCTNRNTIINTFKRYISFDYLFGGTFKKAMCQLGITVSVTKVLLNQVRAVLVAKFRCNWQRFFDYLAKIASNDFLSGRTKHKFKVSWWWLCNFWNIDKVLSGKYDFGESVVSEDVIIPLKPPATKLHEAMRVAIGDLEYISFFQDRQVDENGRFVFVPGFDRDVIMARYGKQLDDFY